MTKIDPHNLPPSLNTPETDPAARRPEDLTHQEKFVAKVKGMLTGDEYAYAESTLRSILTNVVKRGWETEGERRAVENIADKPYSGTNRGRHQGGW